MAEAILDVKTLKAPIVVVRFTVFGDKTMYKLYLKKILDITVKINQVLGLIVVLWTT